MTVTQQIVEYSKNRGQALASLGIIERPLTRQNVDELAAVAAQNTVEGFIAQDRLDFDGAVL
ncbi:MAG TPA: hypothetical protein VF910_05480, partial [Candidatus Bathyarchaeia archaeon]